MKWFLLLVMMGVAWAAERHVVVGGLGGEPEYETRFAMQANEVHRLLGGQGVVLTGAAATKARIKEEIERVGKAATAEDSLAVVLIGHGTWDQQVWKFNVPGPDVSAEELRGWLEGVKAKQLVVLAASASGAAQDALKGPNRVVLCATKSGMEKNAVVFPRYFVEALGDAGADKDKSESLSAVEAFEYAKAKVANFFEVQKRLATEHSVMEETPVAARFTVVRMGSAQKALNDPAKRALLAKKEELEGKIDQLKREKAAMSLADYRKALNALLMQLAKTQEEIEK